MSEGISNFQIEEEINDNFVGAFPATQMTKFIDYKSIMSDVHL